MLEIQAEAIKKLLNILGIEDASITDAKKKFKDCSIQTKVAILSRIC